VKEKLFAVATLSTKADGSGNYKLTASLALAPNKTAAIKLAVGGVPRGYHNHECQVAQATGDFVQRLTKKARIS